MFLLFLVGPCGGRTLSKPAQTCVSPEAPPVRSEHPASTPAGTPWPGGGRMQTCPGCPTITNPTSSLLNHLVFLSHCHQSPLVPPSPDNVRSTRALSGSHKTWESRTIHDQHPPIKKPRQWDSPLLSTFSSSWNVSEFRDDLVPPLAAAASPRL